MLYSSRFLFNRAEIRSNITWICVIISAILGFVSPDDILLVIIVILLLDVAGYLCNAGMVRDVENAADIRKVFERYVYNLPLDEGSLHSSKSSLYEKIDNIIRRHKEEHDIQTHNSGYDTPPGVKDWFDIKDNSATPTYSCQRYNIGFDRSMMRFQRVLYAVIIVMLTIVTVFSLRHRGITNMTKVLELRIKNVMDPDQMAMYRQEIAECIEQYKADYLAGEQAGKEYLDHSRVLNKRSAVQNVATAASFAAEVLVSPVAKLTGKTILTRSVNDSFESHRTKRKEHSIKVADELFGYIGSIDELESPVNAIDRFIETLKKPIEIVCIEGEYYTNLPCSESQ